MVGQTLSPELLHKLDAYWRAANYLSVGQIYLYDNPLLKRPARCSTRCVICRICCSLPTCRVMEHQECLRQVVCQAAELEVPCPGLMASLGYRDACRSAWLTANLIQAQRDYFGAHTYERIDAKGTFHTQWEKA